MRIGTVIAILGTSVIAACAADRPAPSTTNGYMQAAYRQFDAHFDACTAAHGYDPDRTQDLGDHELGPNERAWRSCVYEGAERYIIPSSKMGERYEALIRADSILTDGVEQGRVTREERDSKIAEMLSEIRSRELDIMIAEDPREKQAVLEKEQRFTRRMADSLRSLRSPGRF